MNQDPINPLEIPFGPADFILDEGLATEIRFDGAQEFQAEGGEITLTPEVEDVVILDYGTTPWDQRLVGWTAEGVISAARQTLKIMHSAMSFTNQVLDDDGKMVAVEDARIGSSARMRGRTLTIRPRNAADRSQDIYLYKVIAVGDFNRTFGNEQGNVPLNFTVLPRDGGNAAESGNYFYIGDRTGLDTP